MDLLYLRPLILDNLCLIFIFDDNTLTLSKVCMLNNFYLS